MKGYFSDVFPYPVRINGIGEIACLRGDVAEMKFKEPLPRFYKKFGHQVYNLFGQLLVGEEKPVRKIHAGHVLFKAGNQFF